MGEQSIAGEARLMDCSESTIGLSLPSPLNERLDQLVRLAEGAGERTTRKRSWPRSSSARRPMGRPYPKESGSYVQPSSTKPSLPMNPVVFACLAMAQDRDPGSLDRPIRRLSPAVLRGTPNWTHDRP